jgi:putative exporter of polyketide antibiotics
LFDSALFRRLRSGPLVSSILKRIDSKLEQSDEVAKQKVYAISGHDSTIAGFLRAFGIKPAVFPLFATALIIELHQDEVCL